MRPVRGGRLARRLGILLALSIVPIVIAAIAFAAYVALGVAAGGSSPTGTLAGLGVAAPVEIARDARGIPHVRARSERDLYFADGFLQARDRLFQLDLNRRAVAGRLAEIFGNVALASDLDARTIDVAAIVDAQYAKLDTRQRDDLEAFANGVNAEMRTQPLPPEFRVLAYRPRTWTARDSLLASFATTLDLTQSWNDVALDARVVDALGAGGRDAFFSVTDPAYDSPIAPRTRAPVAPLPPLSIAYPAPAPLSRLDGDLRAGLGSNDFVAGGALTASHRALLGNDPHLELRMPGVWWLVDLEAPGIHVAGATLPGVPGIVLGHDEHVAWGATNGTIATVRVFRETFTGPLAYRAGNATLRASVRQETFDVRFGKPVARDYLRTRHGFVFEDDGATKLAAAWTADLDRRSPLATFDALARATSVSAARAALARYPGPSQNFVLADDAGRAGYVMAGEIPVDDAWGMAVRDGATARADAPPNVPDTKLPQLAADANVLAFTANDRTYGAGYPYRLTTAFSPPYRAARIAQMLHAPFDVAAFSAIQADPTSLAERDLARRAALALRHASLPAGGDLARVRDALATFDGRFTGDSHAAVYVYALRLAATQRLVRFHLEPELASAYLRADSGVAFVGLMRALRDEPRGWVPRDDYDAFLVDASREAVRALRARGAFDVTWSALGARTAQHPLAPFGFKIWNGTAFPGFGDAYSPHVQAPANAQSFRAVWQAGDWNAGGISIPQGESGEPGSPHYRDLAPAWLAGTLVPLPFGDDAVRAATRETLELRP